VYFCSGSETPDVYRHYGLAAGTYTHFTSPIRRYADVVVHRLLAASIGWEPLPTTVTKARVAARAAHINRRHKAAQYAGRESSAQFTLRFFRGRRVLADAHVTRVKANGFTALVGRYGVEAIVHLAPLPPKSSASHRRRVEASGAAGWQFDAERHTLTREASDDAPAVRVRVFDRVRVVVLVDETRPHDVRLKLVCVEPAIGEGALPEYQALLAESDAATSTRHASFSDTKSRKKRAHDNATNDDGNKRRKRRERARAAIDANVSVVAEVPSDETQSLVDVPVALLDDEQLPDDE